MSPIDAVKILSPELDTAPFLGFFPNKLPIYSKFTLDITSVFI